MLQIMLAYLTMPSYVHWFETLIILDWFITHAFVLDYSEEILNFNHSHF